MIWYPEILASMSKGKEKAHKRTISEVIAREEREMEREKREMEREKETAQVNRLPRSMR